MKKLILIITLISLFADTYAQYGTPLAYRKKQHDEMMLKGKQKSDSALYFDAYDKFSKAEYWANTEKEKIAAADGMEKAIKDIKKQKQLTDSLLIVSQKALARADEMQRKVETAMFDKAVKERNKEWKGYANYDWKSASLVETKKGKAILEKIDSLDLSNNALLRIPREVSECKNLKHLNLSNNNLENLSNEIGNLTNLTSLDLGWNRNLISLPAEIGNLKNLTSLVLRTNNLTNLPAKIGNLKNLTSLNLWNNKLTNLPTEIGNLANLTFLNLNLNKNLNLESVFDAFAKYKKSIIISTSEYNRNSDTSKLLIAIPEQNSFPDKISNLRNLTFLDLSGSNLTSVPSEIGNLTNLVSLSLWGNNLNSLPPEIGNLTNLASLDLRGNNLNSLPPEIGNLTNLISLDLGGGRLLTQNQLTNLPIEIGKLSNLTRLDITNNLILSLPLELKTFLQKLEKFEGDFPLEGYYNSELITELDWSEMKLKSIPLKILSLKNLKKINIKYNSILSLPLELKPFFEKLEKFEGDFPLEYYFNSDLITELDWRYKNLTSLPAEIGNLKNLTSLELGRNKLTSLPAEIGNLKNLASLNFGGNQITDIQLVSKLENLEELSFWGNPITNIPLEIAQFKNFKVLYLDGFSNLKIPTENLTEFIKTCPKKVQLTEKYLENKDNSILLINVKPIAEEWKNLPNVEVIE